MDYVIDILITVFVLSANILFLYFIIPRLKNRPLLRPYFYAIIFTLIWQGLDISIVIINFSESALFWVWRLADTAALLHVVFLVFFVVVLTGWRVNKWSRAAFAAGTAAVLAAVFLSGRYIIGIQPHEYTRIQDIGGPAKLFHSAWLMVMFVLMLYLLIKRFRMEQKIANRRQLKIIIAGAFLSIAPAVITELIFPRINIVWPRLGGVATTIFIASIMIAIYRFQFLDIRPKRFSITSKLAASFFAASALSSAIGATIGFSGGIKPVITGLAVIAVAFAMSLLMIRFFVRPINRLVSGTKELAKGNLGARIDIASRDEFGDLAESYNYMAGELLKARVKETEYSRELEKRVDEKTRELRKILARTEGDKKELEKQRSATLNILEDAHESQQELEAVNAQLKKHGAELESLRNLGNELVSVFDINEAIEKINWYLGKILDFSTATYIIIDPMGEGGVIYYTYLKEEVGEEFISEVDKELLKFISKQTDPGMMAVRKIISNIKPRISGKKINNSKRRRLGSKILFPLESGGHLLGVVQIASAKMHLEKGGVKGLPEAMIASFSLAIARLHTLIRSQHSKIISLVESLSDGVVMFNNKKDIILVNPAVENFTGLSREGFNIDEIDKLFKAVDIKKIINKALNDGSAVFVSDAALKTRYFEILAIPVKDNQRNVVGGAIIIHDITHIKEVDKIKTEFVSVASHQLRTPLTAIKLFTEMMLDGQVGKLNKGQREYLDNIFQSTERMVRLVNDLLSLSRLESGRLRIEPKSTNLYNFILNIIEEVEPLAQVKGVKIELKDSGIKLPPISVDINLMRQVINNLITNAVRYSAGGKGMVQVDFSKVKDNYLLEIKDNGIGIPKEVQSRIFEKFFRADNAIKNETEGTGLGLYVSKMIVENSGGKIWFESKKGKGAAFFVALPMSGMIRKKGDRSLPGAANEVNYS